MKNLVKTTDKIMECGVKIRNAKAQCNIHDKSRIQFLEMGMVKESKDLELIIIDHMREYVEWKIKLRFQLAVALTELENLN